MTDLEMLHRDVAASMERAARFIESQTPESLRAWAGRIESNFAPKGKSLVVRDLRNFAAMLTLA